VRKLEKQSTIAAHFDAFWFWKPTGKVPVNLTDIYRRKLHLHTISHIMSLDGTDTGRQQTSTCH
jgi:hypothetical protein